LHTCHSIPFWNPYIFGGIPFWAHFESTIFYPLGFLFWIIPPEQAYGYTMFIHIVLCGLFMYILARSLHIGRAGSLLAASVFAANGFVMAILYLGQMCPVQSYIWLPLVIYFVNQAVRSDTPLRSAAIAGLFWGVQILGGAPQDAFYTFLAAFLFMLCSAKRDSKIGAQTLNLLSVALILFFVGVGIAAIQLVPAWEFTGESVRTGLDGYAAVTSGSYPPEGIITTVMPHFFGRYTEGNVWVSDVPWSIPQQNLHVGILPLFLLFFVPWRQESNRKLIIFAGSLVIIAFVLALGRHTPVYRLVYLLPGFDRFRAPSKIIVLWVFAMALLAGKGMDELLRRGGKGMSWREGVCVSLVLGLAMLDALFHVNRDAVTKFFSPFMLDAAIPERMGEAANIICQEFHRFTLLSTSCVLVVVLWARGIFSAKPAAALLCIILAVDLAHANGKAIEHRDGIYGYLARTKEALDRSVGQDKDLFRIGSHGSGLGPNMEMYLGYQTVGGFTALFLHRYYEYINRYFDNTLPEGWQYFFYGNRGHAQFMDLLNVKYEVSYETKSFGRRKTYLPRAFIVPSHKVLKKNQVLDYLTRSDFDPTQVVLLEENPRQQLLSQRASEPSHAKLMSYGPDHIEISADLSISGYLFLSEIFYPGWKVFVDGCPERIFRGNYLFRVLPLSEGKHAVRFVFDPLSIKVGIGLSIMTLFLIILVMVYSLGKPASWFSRRWDSSKIC
jgi:hypothetical protein